MTLKPGSLVRAGLLWYVAAAIAAQSVAPPSYNWLERTISALGAQGLPNGWIMRVGMIGYGLLLGTGIVNGLVRRRRVNGSELLLLAHACFITLTGLISTSPFVPGVAYSAVQGLWHWNFAMASGASLGLSMAWHLLTESDRRTRLVHLTAVVLLAAFSVGFGLASARTIAVGPGLVQRLLHGVGLVWLWARYGRPCESAAPLRRPGLVDLARDVD